MWEPGGADSSQASRPVRADTPRERSTLPGPVLPVSPSWHSTTIRSGTQDRRPPPAWAAGGPPRPGRDGERPARGASRNRRRDTSRTRQAGTRPGRGATTPLDGAARTRRWRRRARAGTAARRCRRRPRPAGSGRRRRARLHRAPALRPTVTPSGLACGPQQRSGVLGVGRFLLARARPASASAESSSRCAWSASTSGPSWACAARTDTLSSATDRNPPLTAARTLVSSVPTISTRLPSARTPNTGECPVRTPMSPSVVLAITMVASPDHSWRSGTTSATCRVTAPAPGPYSPRPRSRRPCRTPARAGCRTCPR